MKLFYRLALEFTRTKIGRRLAKWIFRLMLAALNLGFPLPLKKLHETPTLLAFYHPHPAYPVHILIIPRAPIANLAALPPENTAFLTDLIRTTQTLISELGLETRGYRLICNGGPNQDIPHLHFHLISE